MKKIGFLGACNKTNLIMYVAKAITSMDKKVLVIDTTIDQKTKYIVPSINPTKSYIVDFEGIDFAIGFEDIKEVEKYLSVKENLPYDYLLIDIDFAENIDKFEIESIDKHYFVTSFDMYSLVKGVEILSNISEPLRLTKILYSYDMNEQDEEQLNYLSMEKKAVWNDETIYLPRTMEDEQVIEENQKVYKIRIKKLSLDYQNGIFYIAQNILEEKNANKIKKSIKE